MKRGKRSGARRSVEHFHGSCSIAPNKRKVSHCPGLCCWNPPPPRSETSLTLGKVAVNLSSTSRHDQSTLRGSDRSLTPVTSHSKSKPGNHTAYHFSAFSWGNSSGFKQETTHLHINSQSIKCLFSLPSFWNVPKQLAGGRITPRIFWCNLLVISIACCYIIKTIWLNRNDSIGSKQS